MTTAPVSSVVAAPQDDPAQIPSMPLPSNLLDPSTSELVTLAAYLQELASGCKITAEPGEPRNPYATIGAMRCATVYLHELLKNRLADEERNLLLLERLRHEANQEAAHERLMAEDDEYAAEFEGDDDEQA